MFNHAYNTSRVCVMYGYNPIILEFQCFTDHTVLSVFTYTACVLLIFVLNVRSYQLNEISWFDAMG